MKLLLNYREISLMRTLYRGPATQRSVQTTLEKRTHPLARKLVTALLKPTAVERFH